MCVCVYIYVCVYVYIYIYVKLKITQSCLTLCNPMDYAVYGILQARLLEWVAFSLSRRSSQCRDLTQVSHIYICVCVYIYIYIYIYTYKYVSAY